MRYGNFALAGASAVIVVLMASTALTAGQPPQVPAKNAGPAKAPAQTSTAAKTSKIPRTLYGKPDLQGLWSFSILTPLQRPGGSYKEELTEDEATALEEAAQQRQIDLRIEPTNTPPGQKTPDAYNTFWRDGFFTKVPATSLRTSQVVDPPDGRIPPLTPEAQQRLREANERRDQPASGPEDRPIDSRCIRGMNSGPPIIGAGAGSYLNNLQIVQDPRHVVILQEVIHEAQIVPLDGRPHLPENLHLWKGNSRGRWEGDRLVIDSTNFRYWALGTNAFKMHGITEKMHLVEHYELLDEDRLLYGFTIDDPGTWTRPWSAEFVMWRMKDQKMLVEYACHEGNRSMANTLAGARVAEKEAAATGRPVPKTPSTGGQE